MSTVVFCLIVFPLALSVNWLTDVPFWAMLLTAIPYGAWVAMREDEGLIDP